MNKTLTRTVFYISDGTGISVEALGHSLMTQFDKIPFQFHTLPYIDSEEKALTAVSKINEFFSSEEHRPIIFSTIVKPEIRNIIAKSKGLVIDFFQSFIGVLEQELKIRASKTVGLSHAVVNEEQYNTRIEAVNFALNCDDGVNTHAYDTADIILVGASRTGKTPTCLYLALQFGIRAANYPLTEEDLNNGINGNYNLPECLMKYRSKVFGLTISADRLQQIRSKRRPNSTYASMAQCKAEIMATERLFKAQNIKHFNSTHLSIEELSTHIMKMAELKRKT